MDKQEYTVFTKYGWQNSHPEVGFTVEEICAWYEWECGMTPIAWCAGRPEPSVVVAHAESIAAGRLIEKVDGKWIARGVEQEKRETTFGDLLRQVLERPPVLQSKYLGVDWAKGMDSIAIYQSGITIGEFFGKVTSTAPDPIRPPLDWNKPASTDRFPGFTTTSGSAKQEQQSGSFGSFGAFKSPDLIPGPADHLNASRHQMAIHKG